MKISVAKNKYIEISPKNGRELTLLHNIDAVNIFKANKEIIELDFYGTKIAVGQSIELQVLNKPYTYEINHIIQKDSNSFELLCEKQTKSSIFLFPLVIQKETISKHYFYNTYFYNAYINFEGLDEFNDGKHLFLVYRFFVSDYFNNLETFLQKHPNFIKTHEPNKELTVFIMGIPLMFQADCSKILKGKYSAITPTAKSRIITFHQAHIESELSHILHKNKKLKEKIEKMLDVYIPEDVELCSKPEIVKERFSYV